MKDIYDQTNFRISHHAEEIDFTLDTLPSFPPFDGPFAILTAWNPNNKPLSLEENMLRNEQLFEKLLEYGHPFDEALGYLDDHSEESYCIYGIPFEEAIELAKAEEQYAIFFSSATHVGYYECERSGNYRKSVRKIAFQHPTLFQDIRPYASQFLSVIDQSIFTT